MAATIVLGTIAERRVGSSPTLGTKDTNSNPLSLLKRAKYASC